MLLSSTPAWDRLSRLPSTPAVPPPHRCAHTEMHTQTLSSWVVGLHSRNKDRFTFFSREVLGRQNSFDLPSMALRANFVFTGVCREGAGIPRVTRKEDLGVLSFVILGWKSHPSAPLWVKLQSAGCLILFGILAVRSCMKGCGKRQVHQRRIPSLMVQQGWWSQLEAASQ